MAIATGTAIALGISAAASAGQAIAGEVRRSKAKKALEDFQRQELKNVAKGLRVSTLGAELQTQEAQRRFATSVEALRSGGVRGLVGGLGQQEQLQQQQQAQISADLDRQQMAIEQMIVQDEAEIRELREIRESGEIAGIGDEMAFGRQQTQQGLQGVASTAASAFGSLDSNLPGGGEFMRSSPNTLDLSTGGKVTQGLISPKSTRFIQGPSGISDASKSFGFTRDIGAAQLSTETPSLMQTYINTGKKNKYGLKPR